MAVFTANAQQTNVLQDEQHKQALSMLGDDYQNSIPILQNRFRIDYEVGEVTMLFFRTYGSAPVVLVKPDGTKLFQSRLSEDVSDWVYSASFDVIKMKNPTPGPWQAMGQILPGSKIMVLSDIQLHVQPLPTVLFSGQILKQTARLTNGGQPIDVKEFRDVVDLSIKMVSTNNPNFDNFGAQDAVVATFKDDGRGMDEVPKDGVFTGQYNLNIGDGEWRPIFIVESPLYSREQQGLNTIVYPNPVETLVDLDETDRGYHILTFNTDLTHVEISSLLIDGKVRYPNGDVQNFSITETSTEQRTHRITNYETGIFRVKITVYGNTLDDRNFILDVPEFTFLVDPNKLAAEVAKASPTSGELLADPAAGSDSTLTTESSPASSALITEAESLLADVEEPEEETDNTLVVSLIVGINLLLLIAGGLILFFFVKPKGKTGKKAAPKMEKATSDKADKPKQDIMELSLDSLND